ncbi:hypothetical protein [Ideonella sp. BN130291]|uniref:hypothetical protein n=1 Tax=Ideonella sp. BN130291 TaxID=3112940 RepID=UPI002E252FAF|nr:hypothetical protein [Ideonella sp. BN130291]
MWSKVLKPVPVTTLGTTRPAPAALPSAPPARPTRVLQSSRTPQQLSFEFRRG